MYTAYVLDEKSREVLLQRFPPKYKDVVGHHITVEFGVSADTLPPQDAKLRVIGHIDNGDGLEALAVLVDGSTVRKDGKTYHITWSLDCDKFKPKDSNMLLESKQFLLTMPIDIVGMPTVQQ